MYLNTNLTLRCNYKDYVYTWEIISYTLQRVPSDLWPTDTREQGSSPQFLVPCAYLEPGNIDEVGSWSPSIQPPNRHFLRFKVLLPQCTLIRKWSLVLWTHETPH